MFIFYELLLIPSFFLIYSTSYSRRSIKASFYFLIWTQIGSLLVLLSIILLISYKKDFYLTNLNVLSYLLTQNKYLIYFIVLLLVLGFGIKIPIWPFHYWITKTHVESPTAFSIFLSGFLVKTAIYSLYKIFSFIIPSNGIISVFLFCIFIFGYIDSSLKFLLQIDFKKLVAYCTIQEMNMISIFLFFNDYFLIKYVYLFVITHTFLSIILFYLVDLIYKRYYSRSLLYINCIFNNCQILPIFIFLSLLFYSGIPFTMKFVIEFIFINYFIYDFFFLILFLFFINFLSIIGFSKSIFNMLYGYNKLNVLDLNYLESIKLFILFFFQILILFLFKFF